MESGEKRGKRVLMEEGKPLLEADLDDVGVLDLNKRCPLRENSP